MHAISDYQRVCEDSVRAAGALLIDRMGRVEVREKGPADLVTEADLASQDLVRQRILAAFPSHSVLGEEGGLGAAAEAEFRWILDPLDGTTNYVHRYPFFSVSLALERNGELLVAAVYNPNDGECCTAAAGQGARLNGQPIHTSSVSRLSQAVAAASLPARPGRDSPDLVTFNGVAVECQSIRRTGSAALNFAYLAAGRVDVCWSFSTKVWDIAAGVLLVREAGGVATGPEGGPLILDRGHFLAAANPQLHAEFQTLVRRALGAV